VQPRSAAPAGQTQGSVANPLANTIITACGILQEQTATTAGGALLVT
jgi:hypothetical protein